MRASAVYAPGRQGAWFGRFVAGLPTVDASRGPAADAGVGVVVLVAGLSWPNGGVRFPYEPEAGLASEEPETGR